MVSQAIGVGNMEVLERTERVEPLELRTRTRTGEKGRIVIPAAMREALGIVDGDILDLQVVDGELRVATMRERIRRAQERVRHLVPPGTLVSDELSADRREAARNE